MTEWTLYYNPKCGTCRNVLAALEKKGIRPQIVEYLKNPPSPGELNDLLTKLNKEPRQIVREQDPLFSELSLGQQQLSRKEWLIILSNNPILIQRPIVVKDNQAIVARPWEKINELIG